MPYAAAPVGRGLRAASALRVALPDVRRGGGHRDQSRTLEARAGHGAAVAVDVADALAHRESGARGGQGTVDALAPSLRERGTAPEPGQLGALDPVEAP